MSILIIDNYDSFTFNLLHMLEKLTDEKVSVFRNDEISLDEVSNYKRIVISPGPGLPKDAGVVNSVIQKYYSSKEILGVCLGHQAIAEAFGGKLINLPKVKHGQSSAGSIIVKTPLFSGLPSSIEIGHYHSWVVSDPLPDGFEVTMRDSENYIMAMQHSSLPIYGVQFHPESVLTPHGSMILKNWLALS